MAQGISSRYPRKENSAFRNALSPFLESAAWSNRRERIPARLRGDSNAPAEQRLSLFFSIRNAHASTKTTKDSEFED